MNIIQLLIILVRLSMFVVLAGYSQPINPDDNDPQRSVLIEPFNLVDNIYYVGATVHHSSYLLTSSEGHILVDATYERFVPTIIENIEKLGFNPSDIKLIVSNHAHPDHVEGLSAMREYTGASTIATAADAEVIESPKANPKPRVKDETKKDK